MPATRLHSPGGPLRIEECPVPHVGPGEVLVRVAACGVCGSDVHMWRGAVPVRRTPIVLGHEIAGTVAACGPECGSWKPGDAVIVRAGSVGMGQEPVGLPPPALFAWREHSVLGSFGSTRRDLGRVLEMVQSGRLDLGHSISARLPLKEVNRALGTRASGQGDQVRLVILPWEGV